MDFVAELKEKADIVQIITQSGVNLKRSGNTGRYIGLCPLHQEKTPSFSVDFNKQYFHCFGCNESGDVYKFLEKTRNIDFKEAVKELAGILGEPMPRFSAHPGEKSEKELLYETVARSAEFYHNTLLNEKIGATAMAYLEARGITKDLCRKYKIGFAPDPKEFGWTYLYDKLSVAQQDLAKQAGLIAEKNNRKYDFFRNRIMVPIKNKASRMVGFTARNLGEDGPKYLNSPETPIFKKDRILFGFSDHITNIRLHQKILLVEGCFDVISIENQQIDYACAPLGTSFTEHHVRLLKNAAQTATLYLFYDGDSAGMKALLKIAPLLLNNNLTAYVISTPKNHDPDTFLREKGRAAFEELLTNAIPVVEFIATRLLLEKDGSMTREQRLINTIGELLNNIPSPTFKQAMVVHLSSKLNVEPKILAEEFSVALQENILAIKGSASGSPKQFALRVAALLLHAPDYIAEADKHGLGRYCTDEFTLAVFHGCHTGHIQMKEDKRWASSIKKMLRPSGLNNTIIATNGLKGEFEAILDWKIKLEIQEDLIVEMTKLQENLEQGVLPEN